MWLAVKEKCGVRSTKILSLPRQLSWQNLSDVITLEFCSLFKDLKLPGQVLVSKLWLILGDFPSQCINSNLSPSPTAGSHAVVSGSACAVCGNQGEQWGPCPENIRDLCSGCCFWLQRGRHRCGQPSFQANYLKWFPGDLKTQNLFISLSFSLSPLWELDI